MDLINIKQGFVDSEILGSGERFGFTYVYRLKIKHITDVKTELVIKKEFSSGGYQDMYFNDVPEEVQRRAIERTPGFMKIVSKMIA